MTVDHPCQCEIPDGGFCARHQMQKTATMARLCRNPRYFEAWEKGHGPKAAVQVQAIARLPDFVGSERPPFVATRAMKEKRLKICSGCKELEACAPTVCAKRDLIDSGTCKLDKWDDRIDYTKPVPDSTDYPALLAEYPGFERTMRQTKLTSLPPCAARPTRLYAMLSTWHDADIVEAAIANLFAEGAQRVYILDNDSPDGTAHLAVKAGAILAQSYTTAYFQDVLRVRLLNSIMRDITEAEKHPELWWLCSDVDEMIRGPGKRTVREFLETLPDDVNIVGANALDHYPDKPVANVRGEHPAKYQPMVWLRNWPNGAFCGQKHWKHPLHRYRDGKYTAAWMRGLHDSRCHKDDGPPIEARETLLLHHFMFRNEADTRERHRRLCEPDPALGGNHRSKPDDDAIAAEGATTRWQNLDYIYSGQWEKARMPHLQAWRELHKGGIPAQHWTKVVIEEDYTPRIR